MEYKKLYLAILIAAIVGLLFAAMSALWVGFLCFFGLALVFAAITFSFIQYSKRNALKERVYPKRYEDAYKYADETGQKLDVAHFKYPRKQEVEIKRQLHDSSIIFFSSILLSVFSVVVTVMIFINVL